MKQIPQRSHANCIFSEFKTHFNSAFKIRITQNKTKFILKRFERQGSNYYDNYNNYNHNFDILCTLS